MKIKHTFFTNIPAPYRIDMFNRLQELSGKENFSFEVLFMRKTEYERSWNVNLNSINFDHKIGKGLYIPSRLSLHLNPLLIKRAIKADHLVLGASWNNLNVLLIVLLKKLGLIKCKLSLWSEANYLTNFASSTSKLRDSLRHFVFNSLDGVVLIPGEMAKISIQMWKLPVRKFVYLPNLISSVVYKPHLRAPFSNRPPIFFTSMRLHEETKGLLNFLNALGVDRLKKVIIRVAGDGSDKKIYEKYIQDNALQNNVLLLGHLNSSEMSEEYKNADFFFLPSFSDPSPLSVIEAIHSGLPLLISERCGNHFEACVGNGYTFDPSSIEDIKSKFDLLIVKTPFITQLSEASLHRAKEHFNLDKSLSALIRDLNSHIK